MKVKIRKGKEKLIMNSENRDQERKIRVIWKRGGMGSEKKMERGKKREWKNVKKEKRKK